MRSLSRLCSELGVILSEQQRQYEAFYGRCFGSEAAGDNVRGRSASPGETRSAEGAGQASRTLAEANAQIARFEASVIGEDSSSSDDEDEPEVGEVVEAIEAGDDDLVPHGGRDERRRALEEGGELVHDSRYHATLHMCTQDPPRMPVAYPFMLHVPSNYQGRLHFRSCPPLDDIPGELNEKRAYMKRAYHKLQPLPFFPPSHEGYRLRYYRWVFLVFALIW